MGALKLVVVTAILYLSVSTSAPVLGKKVPNLPEETNTSKDNNDKFETLPKLQGSSETKSRTLLDENLMNVTEEDDEDLAVEGSGEDQLAKDKKESNLDEDDDYLDDDDYYDDEEEEDDEDIYDDEVKKCFSVLYFRFFAGLFFNHYQNKFNHQRTFILG